MNAIRVEPRTDYGNQPATVAYTDRLAARRNVLGAPDEFWIRLEDLRKKEDVERGLNKLLATIRKPFTMSGQTVCLSATSGVAFAPEDGMHPDQRVTSATTALHRAQQAGQGEVQYFRAEMHAQVRQRIRLEQALKVAIEGGELRVWYQPQIELATGMVTGVEALVRWENPEWGLVSPADSIPLAEDTGRVVPLGSWVLEQALTDYSQSQRIGLPVRHVSVNMAAAQLQSRDFEGIVAGSLQRTGCLQAAWSWRSPNGDSTAT